MQLFRNGRTNALIAWAMDGRCARGVFVESLFDFDLLSMALIGSSIAVVVVAVASRAHAPRDASLGAARARAVADTRARAARRGARHLRDVPRDRRAGACITVDLHMFTTLRVTHWFAVVRRRDDDDGDRGGVDYPPVERRPDVRHRLPVDERGADDRVDLRHAGRDRRRHPLRRLLPAARGCGDAPSSGWCVDEFRSHVAPATVRRQPATAHPRDADPSRRNRCLRRSRRRAEGDHQRRTRAVRHVRAGAGRTELRHPARSVARVWITSAVFLHTLGSAWFYAEIVWWDHLTHALSATLVAGAGYGAARRRPSQRCDPDPDPLRVRLHLRRRPRVRGRLGSYSSSDSISSPT